MLSKELYSYKIHTLSMKGSTYAPPSMDYPLHPPFLQENHDPPLLWFFKNPNLPINQGGFTSWLIHMIFNWCMWPHPNPFWIVNFLQFPLSKSVAEAFLTKTCMVRKILEKKTWQQYFWQQYLMIHCKQLNPYHLRSRNLLARKTFFNFQNLNCFSFSWNSS